MSRSDRSSAKTTNPGPAPIEEEMRREGLQALARMIAHMYIRDIRAESESIAEHAERIPKTQGDSGAASAREKHTRTSSEKQGRRKSSPNAGRD